MSLTRHGTTGHGKNCVRSKVLDASHGGLKPSWHKVLPGSWQLTTFGSLSVTLCSFLAVHCWLPNSAQTIVSDGIPAVPYGHYQDPDMPSLNHCLVGRSQSICMVTEIAGRAIFPDRKMHEKNSGLNKRGLYFIVNCTI